MFKKALLAVAVATAATGVQAKTPSLEELYELVQAQQAEIQRLKAKLGETDAKVEKTEAQVAQTDAKVEATADALEQGAAGTYAANDNAWFNNTSIGGYGEHHYNNFDSDSGKNNKVDAHRFVLFVGHEFNENLRFFSELEVEHGIAGEGQNGEVELEQAYIEYDFAKGHSAQFGQFLIPVGLINETHEPDTFYGVERNNVEKNIIPATWWETGVQVKGEIAPGLNYNLAVHSGLNSVDDGAVTSIRGGRQKSSNANAEDLAYTGRLKYTGVQGLELAASVQYQEDITQDLLGQNDAMLYEAHAAYQFDNFKFTGLYAMWDIDGLDFEDIGADEQDGWYLEGSYRFNEKLGFFVRESAWDNFAGNDGRDTETRQFDYGVNYWLAETVVLKADIANQRGYKAADSFNLGVGWSF